MTRLLRRLAPIAIGGMFAFGAVSFADFFTCGSGEGAGISDETNPPRRAN